MKTIETSTMIISKGVSINIDYTSCEVTTNMLIDANGNYNHHLELELEEGYIYFTWSCEYHNDEILHIQDGKKIDNNLTSFIDFLGEYFNVTTQYYYDDEHITIVHRDAFKEIIVIMEQVFKFEDAYKAEISSKVFDAINDIIITLGTNAAFNESDEHAQELLKKAEEIDLNQETLCENFNYDYDDILEYLSNELEIHLY